MIQSVVTGAIAVVALVTAAWVETHAGDPTPYLGVAILCAGYASGHAVATAKKTRR